MINWSLLIVLWERGERQLRVRRDAGTSLVSSSWWKKQQAKSHFLTVTHAHLLIQSPLNSEFSIENQPCDCGHVLLLFSICCAHMFRKRIERGRRKRGSSWLVTFEESTGVIPAWVTGGTALSHAHLHSVFPSYSSTYKEIILVTQGKQKRFQTFYILQDL